MEFKGTKGRWHINGTRITDSRGHSIVQETGYYNFNEWKANALLISKAPEMLEILQRVNESLLNDPSTIEQIDLRQEVEVLINEITQNN